MPFLVRNFSRIFRKSDKTFESDLSSKLSFYCTIPCFEILVGYLESQLSVDKTWNNLQA